jgi:hypothetical protein
MTFHVHFKIESNKEVQNFKFVSQNYFLSIYEDFNEYLIGWTEIESAISYKFDNHPLIVLIAQLIESYENLKLCSRTYERHSKIYA